MSTQGPIPPRAPEPPRLDEHAIRQIRYIRETIDRAARFTAVPGWGQVAMGGAAVIAALVSSRQPTFDRWLAVWIATAVLALAIGGAAMARKARKLGEPLARGAGLRFLASFGPPLLVGALLTFALRGTTAQPRIPGLWLLLYGTGVIAGGAYSVRVVPILGGCFLAVGSLALLAPAGWGTGCLALGFGGLHLLFGALIARRFGG
jgi:hypothetical protein